MNTLRIDGVYQSGLHGCYWEYLRFYANGTVLAVNTVAKPAQLGVWFREEGETLFSRGSYNIGGDRVTFSVRSENGAVDYQGSMEGTVLNLSSYSAVNGHRESNTYRFVQLGRITVAIEAFDEPGAIASATRVAKEQWGDGAAVAGVRLVVAGAKGLLGLGRKPSRYEAEISVQVGVAPPHDSMGECVLSANERFHQAVDRLNASRKDMSHEEYQRALRILVQEADDASSANSNADLGANTFTTTIARNPTTQKILSILDRKLSAGQRQAKLEAAVRGLAFGKSYKEVVYCACGYPIRAIYRDGSSGPLMEILDARQAHDDDPYTHEYLCPRCGKHVQTITS